MTQKENNSKRKKLSKENNGDKPQNAYFLSLELENVRCFGEKQKIDFSDGNDKPRQWTIILGNNGTGKTTILQAIVSMLPNEHFYHPKKDKFQCVARLINFRLAEDWKPFRKIKGEISSIKTKLATSEKLITNQEPKTKAFFLDARSSSIENFTEWEEFSISNLIAHINCFAYGASRKAGETSLSEQNEESAYKTLFDETALLTNPEEWLFSTDYASKRLSNSKGRRSKILAEKRKQQLESVKNTLIKILPDIDEIRFSEKELLNKRISQPIVEFHTHYGWVESKDLSLGYRTSMAWMVDFASRMFDFYPESENPLAEPAVVLIDEIDLHLHPKWQRDLLPWLSDLFPNTQFIVTTHSPLIVQSAVARDANIVVCRREGDHVVIDQSIEAVKNWRADQILTSDFFGLETARPKEIEKDLFERQKILSKAKLTKKDEKRLKELEENIGSMPVMENPEDDKAMDIIRRAAERLQSQK